MAETITWTLNVQVSGGPKVSASDSISVEAYDKIDVTIADGDSDVEVNLQPGGADLAQLVLVSASTYDADLTYKVNAAANPALALDGPHVLIGQGAVSLLDPAATSLFFSNSTGADATVSILIGRDATP